MTEMTREPLIMTSSAGRRGDRPARIRAVIADDEPLARRGVRQLLAPHADVDVVGESRSGPEALDALETLEPDVLFLDIQMPEMNGFDVLRARGPDRMPVVIFVTAHDQFAVRAFEANALDYLVKPINAKRFDAALARTRVQLALHDAAGRALRLAALLAAERAHAGADRLVVRTATRELVIPTAEIDWIGAEDYYACVYVAGRRHLTRESLMSLEGRLDARLFARVHRCAIVRLDRVRESRRADGGDEVVLRDGTRVPVSRRRRRSLDRLLRPLG
jgi:two-component system LytT family response regulator